MSDDPTRPPRFPYVAALLCAGCLGAAAWGWMRYSYRWEITPELLSVAASETDTSHWEDELPWYFGTYVSVRAVVTDMSGGMSLRDSSVHRCCLRVGDTDIILGIEHRWYEADFDRRIVEGEPFEIVGRLRLGPSVGGAYLDTTTTSRFHGASIAGLVVGAMGVFVFTVALRHWLRERRRFREEARGPDHGVERTQDA